MKPKLIKACYWILRIWLCACVTFAALAPRARGQYTGSVSLQTTTQIVFTNQTTSATFLVDNVSQSAHYLSYVNTAIGSPCVMDIRLEASYTGGSTTWFPISEDGIEVSGFSFPNVGLPGATPGLVASGSFPRVRVNLLIPSITTPDGPNACSVTANYTGTSATNGTIQQGFIQSNGYRKAVWLAESPITPFDVHTVPSAYGSTAGRIYLVCYPSCGTGMSFTVTPQSIPLGNGFGSAGVLQTFTPTSGGNIQTFDITPVPAESVLIENNGSAGSATYIIMYYQFINDTDVGNTVNVNCITGCSGGGTGTNIVWGPNAIGAAPTEPPVQVGGLQPNGSVSEIQTDATGNVQVVGPTAQGSVDSGTNPVQIGGTGDGALGSPVLSVTTDQTINPNVIALDVNVAATDSDSAGFPGQTIFTTTLEIAPPATATYTGGGVLDYTSQYLASNILVQVTGTWTGNINVKTTPGGPPSLLNAVMYPVLNGTTDFSAPITGNITSDGNYLILNGGSINNTEVNSGVATGTATVTISGSNPPNAVYVVQPTAANFQAQTQPGAAATNPCTEAPVSFSTTGNNTVVAGVSGKIVRIYEMYIVFGGASNVTLQDGASTALTGAMGLFSGGSVNYAQTGAPHFTTSSGNAFTINLSTGVQASGSVCYAQF